MTMPKDGGPAFPHLHNTCQRVNESEHHEGLSIRAWFAGQALKGLLAQVDHTESGYPCAAWGTGEAACKSIAIVACRFADALLAELTKEETP